MSSSCFDQERLRHPISPALPSTAATAPPVAASFPYRPESPTLIDAHIGGSLAEEHAHGAEKQFTKGGLSGVTIDTLPDVPLLEMFNFYVHADHQFREDELSAWITLVHVSKMAAHSRTPVREKLDVWPPLPIVICGPDFRGVDNIVGLLEHNDRICELDLSLGRDLLSWQLEMVLAAMQRPFPALTLLDLRSKDGEVAPVVPASFLGGSAPCLQELYLCRIPFPGLPKLLLSCAHLVTLCLWNIPHSGYISPEAMVTCLSVTTRLEGLHIEFESPQSRPDQKSRRPPPQTRTRTLLPVLTELDFQGVDEYLEDVVAQIDAPLLDHLMIIYLHPPILDTPQLTQFIGRTPKFKTADDTRLTFSNGSIGVVLGSQTLYRRLGISCRQSDWPLSFSAQICISSFPQGLIPAVEHLYILDSKYTESQPQLWQDDIEGSRWLELLHPFTAVKALYISRDPTPCIASALQELVGEGVTDMLPALQTLFLEETSPSGPVLEAIEQFLPHDSLPVTPFLFLNGKEGPMIDRCSQPLSVPFTYGPSTHRP